MTEERYPKEDLNKLHADWKARPDRYDAGVDYVFEDDGTMPQSRDKLEELIIGHKIVRVDDNRQVEYDPYGYGTESVGSGFVITLDNGKQVTMVGIGDCCAYTEIESFLRNVDSVDHVITGVGTTDAFTTWHIYADMGDMLELKVGWSPGNPFYYGYGFSIGIRDIPEDFDMMQEEAKPAAIETPQPQAYPTEIVPSAPVEKGEEVKFAPTVIDTIDSDIFSQGQGSYFLSNDVVEATPMVQFELFARAMQELQMRAGVNFSVDETSTGIVIAWNSRAA